MLGGDFPHCAAGRSPVFIHRLSLPSLHLTHEGLHANIAWCSHVWQALPALCGAGEACLGFLRLTAITEDVLPGQMFAALHTI